MLKRLLILSLSIVSLLMPTVFAYAASSKNYIEILNTWIGDDADSLLHKWGRPVQVEQTGQNSFDVTYQAETAYYHPAVPPRAWQECMFNGQGQVIGCNDRYDPGLAAYYTYTQCYTVFEVEDGTIIKWRWKGDCKQ